MADNPEVISVLDETDRLFDELIAQQHQKVFKLAREAVPNITTDDILNPHDFPALKAHPTFEYEDGILAGFIAAQIAVRARVLSAHREAGPAPRIPGAG
jgi:hypothetical protein